MGQPGHGRQGETHLDPSLALRHDLIRRSLGRVFPDRSPAAAAVTPPYPGPEQPEIVVYLRCGAHRRAARDDRIALLDGNGGGYAFEPVDQGFRHPVKELLGIGRERLDISPLSLGVEGVERQGTLARSARTGHHDQRSVRQVDRDIPEIILPGVDDPDM